MDKNITVASELTIGLDLGYRYGKLVQSPASQQPTEQENSAMDIEAIQDIELSDSTGATQRLGDYWADRRVVLVFARHFG